MKKAEADHARRGALLDIRVQKNLENKGLESLTEFDNVIRAQCLVEVIQVALQVLNTISDNPGALLTQKVKGEIFALVKEKNAILRGEVQRNLEEARMELHTEINDLRTEMEGGSRQARIKGESGVPEPEPPCCAPARPPPAKGNLHHA